jgi:hypothetical protein
MMEKNKKTVLLICPAIDTAAATESSYADNIHTTRFVTTMTKVTSKIRGSDNFRKLVDWIRFKFGTTMSYPRSIVKDLYYFVTEG